MYPEEVAETNTSWGLKKVFKRFSSSSSGALSRKIPSHEMVQQKMLSIYLKCFKEMLVKLEVKDIYMNTMHIKTIFDQMESPKVHHNEMGHTWLAKGVSQVSVVCLGIHRDVIMILDKLLLGKQCFLRSCD